MHESEADEKETKPLCWMTSYVETGVMSCDKESLPQHE